MLHQNALFAVLAVTSYGLTLLTSSALVRWVLPQKFARNLGSDNRSIPLDGIRGFLALSVFLHHCLITWIFLATNIWQSPSLDFENELGRGAVAVFFMITAFLFWGRIQARKNLELRSFVLARAFRIYPLYLFVLTLVGFSVAWKTHWALHETVGQIATEIVLWLVFWMPDINHLSRTDHLVAGVMWSLRYEAWFYLSLPLAALVVFKSKAVVKKILALAACVALFYLAGLQWSIAIAFAGGILAVYWKANPRRIAWAKTRLATMIAIACLGCVALFRFEPFDVLGIALLSVFFIALASGNTLFGLLQMRGALWMGEISYSIYLCHGFLLWLVVQNVLNPLLVSHLTNAWFAAVVLGLSPVLIVLSSASYLLIERPFIELGHRLGKRSPGQIFGISQQMAPVPQHIQSLDIQGFASPALALECAASGDARPPLVSSSTTGNDE